MNALSFRGSTGTLSPIELLQNAFESHPKVKDLKLHQPGRAQVEAISLAVARDNSLDTVGWCLFFGDGPQPS